MSEYVGPSQELMEHAKHLWGTTKGAFSLIRGNENWVYNLDGTDLIFRFTANYHRTKNELEGELDWIQFLFDKHCHVVMPVASTSGDLVHSLSEKWCVVVFKKAGGQPLMDESQFTQKIFYNWGQTIGEMHRHTKNYTPESIRRQTWDNDDGFRLAGLMIRELGEDHYIAKTFRGLVRTIRELPKNNDTFGLIHADIHHGNFFVDDQEELIVFDFDDSVYSFFAFDLAVPMATMDMRYILKRYSTNLRRYQNTFLEGYAKTNILPGNIDEMVEIFVRYRMAHLYLWGASRIHLKRTNDIPAIENMKSACETYLRKFI